LARGYNRAEGRLTSLELEEQYAELAQSNLTKAGFAEQVSYMTGAALESLDKLAAENRKFDFFFIDADKVNYENDLDGCLQLAEPGALIVARSEEHTSELQSRENLVCRLLLEKKNTRNISYP